MPLSRTTKNSSLKSQITILKKKNEELQRENMLINYKQMNLIRDYNSLRVEHKAVKNENDILKGIFVFVLVFIFSSFIYKNLMFSVIKYL